MNLLKIAILFLVVAVSGRSSPVVWSVYRDQLLAYSGVDDDGAFLLISDFENGFKRRIPLDRPVYLSAVMPDMILAINVNGQFRGFDRKGNQVWVEKFVMDGMMRPPADMGKNWLTFIESVYIEGKGQCYRLHVAHNVENHADVAVYEIQAPATEVNAGEYLGLVLKTVKPQDIVRSYRLDKAQ